MSDKRPSQSDESTDKALSELYRQVPRAQSPASLDDKVLARAAQQADRIRHTSRYAEVRRPVFLARQWVTLAATACVITLSISLVIQMPDKQPWLDSRIESSDASRIERKVAPAAMSEAESLALAERKQARPALKSRAADAAPMMLEQTPKRERLEEVVVTPEAPLATIGSIEEEMAAGEGADAFAKAQEPELEAQLNAQEQTQGKSKAQEYDDLADSAASAAPAFSRALLPETVTAAKRTQTMTDDIRLAKEQTWQPQQWLERVLALWKEEQMEDAEALFARYKNAFPTESTLKEASQRMSQQEQKIISQLQILWQQEQQKLNPKPSLNQKPHQKP